MNRLLLVDGHNLLFQMFFGMPARIVNSEGKAIQGTLGFVGALLKIIRRVRPTHAAVIFDGERGSSRTALDPEYKQNRIDYSEVEEEDNPFSQLDDIYAALDALGICHAETEGCEADDVIASYALGAGADMEVVISSFDSDYFQLITDRVCVLRYRGEKTAICTPSYIREKFGIEPAQYADFKALTGDQADNIRGVKGVGPRRAAALMREFGTLDRLLADSERIAWPSVRAAVEESRERLILNRKLITLSASARCPFEAEALAYTDSGCTTREVLRKTGVW